MKSIVLPSRKFRPSPLTSSCGTVSWSGSLETVNNQYLGGDTSLACSAQTQREIDQKVVELVKTQHEKAIRILTENRAKLDELAQYLYQKETITGEEFMDILNRNDAENKPENP